MSYTKIITDSTCDLSKELIETNNIEIIPLYIVMDDIGYKDGIETHPEDIYQWVAKSGQTPKTSAPTMEDLIKVVERLKQNGEEAVFIGISENMSCTCNSMRLAAEMQDYDKLYVVDSMNLSTGIGHLVLIAAQMAKEGKTGKEIMNKLQEVRHRVRSSFVVNTLDYLYKGGRCSAVTALLANTLRLKPEIVVANGKMGVSRKYRGRQEKVIMNYAEDIVNKMVNIDTKRVFITHSGCDADIVNKVREYLKEKNIFEEILETRAGGVITSHCGPGTLGILYIENEA